MYKQPLQKKFSNLLHAHTEPDTPELQFSVQSSVIANNKLIERIRRKSTHTKYNSFCQKAESFNPKSQNNNVKELINRTKINRVLLQNDFSIPRHHTGSKRKHVYIVRKKSDKKPSMLQQNFKITAQEIYKGTNSQQVKIQSLKQQQTKATHKIKKKPVFGLEDINVSIQSCLKRKIGNAGLFLSTSSNSFFGASFYSTNKRRADVLKEESPEEKLKNLKVRTRNNEMEPEVITLFPKALANQQLLNKKKNINKLYTTNSVSFSYGKLKQQQQADSNDLCGWEKDQGHLNNFDDHFF